MGEPKLSALVTGDGAALAAVRGCSVPAAPVCCAAVALALLGRCADMAAEDVRVPGRLRADLC